MNGDDLYFHNTHKQYFTPFLTKAFGLRNNFSL